jgi:2-keto-4-pentenoate hydratase
MALDANAVQDIATRVLADYDAVKPGELFADGLRLELVDAWRVQAAVTRLRERRGETVIGYKVGCVTPGNQQMMGLDQPVWGRLWASELHETGVRLSKQCYANIAIEAEFAIELATDLKPEMSIDEIAQAVAAVYPTLELHNLVLRSDKPNGHELIANNCINSGVVRGAAVTDLAARRDTDLQLVFDGVVVDQWPTLNWPNDIVGAVLWLTTALAEQGLQASAGDLLLTSAWGPPIPVAENTCVEVKASEFGHVFALFE